MRIVCAQVPERTCNKTCTNHIRGEEQGRRGDEARFEEACLSAEGGCRGSRRGGIGYRGGRRATGCSEGAGGALGERRLRSVTRARLLFSCILAQRAGKG